MFAVESCKIPRTESPPRGTSTTTPANSSSSSDGERQHPPRTPPHGGANAPSPSSRAAALRAAAARERGEWHQRLVNLVKSGSVKEVWAPGFARVVGQPCTFRAGFYGRRVDRLSRTYCESLSMPGRDLRRLSMRCMKLQLPSVCTRARKRIALADGVAPRAAEEVTPAKFSTPPLMHSVKKR